MCPLSSLLLSSTQLVSFRFLKPSPFASFLLLIYSQLLIIVILAGFFVPLFSVAPKQVIALLYPITVLKRVLLSFFLLPSSLELLKTISSSFQPSSYLLLSSWHSLIKRWVFVGLVGFRGPYLVSSFVSPPPASTTQNNPLLEEIP
jgi:hypothetical protein